jgi:two-component sensor histidine kinase
MTQATTPRLLYIDDDAGLARLVQKDFARHGVEVVWAPDGDEGLARLASQSFDAVVLDHFLPMREGIEILADIRAMPDAPPVVYVTGTQEGRVAVAALKAGAVDYVIKDVAEDFLSLLRSAIDDALEREALRKAKEEGEAEVRAARDRAETLLREVNHRIGNSLQLVSSFVSMQARSLTDVAARDALRETQARIEAVAHVHRRLYTSQDVSTVELRDYFSGLCEELRYSMSVTDNSPTISLTAEVLRVPTDRAVSLGVILAELVTNAMKYAYDKDVGGGEIRVRLDADGEGRGVLTVEDDGVGLGAAKPKGTGIGRTIISAMAQNLRSKVDYDPDHRGVRARLAFEY